MEDVKSKPGNRDLIEATAFGLFRECGYRLTSYSKIAEASGLGRPLVQYYFPKKEDLATEFVLAIMRETSSLVKPTDDALVNVARLGQAYYSFLLCDSRMKRLTQDLLSNRQVTSRVIAANAEYTIPAFESLQSNRDILREASIRATGGMYELLFIGLEAGQSPDPGMLAAQNTAAFASMALDLRYQDELSRLKGALAESGEISAICENLNRRIFA